VILGVEDNFATSSRGLNEVSLRVRRRVLQERGPSILEDGCVVTERDLSATGAQRARHLVDARRIVGMRTYVP
jgi:hypothetical protein